MKILSLLSLFIVVCNAYAFSWADLWATKDQQAQTLMNKGQFKEAAARFQQQEWHAAAAYRAGDYAQAAKQYQSQKNESGYYNYANALAHLKQYEQAIKAYDKALAINPNNKDALYNRKLIEELLKNKKKQSNDQGNKNQDKDQQGKDQQGKDQQGKDQQGKDQQGKDQQGKDQQGKDQQGKDQQGKDQQGKDQQGKDQQGKDQQGKDQQGKDQQGKDQQGKDQQGKDQQGKDQQGKDQQGKDQQDKNQLSRPSSKKTDKDAQTSQTAEHEKQQAKEQWLRLIPDDPGGLMREKFLRDHLRRQSGWYQ